MWLLSFLDTKLNHKCQYERETWFSFSGLSIKNFSAKLQGAHFNHHMVYQSIFFLQFFLIFNLICIEKWMGVFLSLFYDAYDWQL